MKGIHFSRWTAGFIFLFLCTPGPAQVYPRWSTLPPVHDSTKAKKNISWLLQLEVENGGMIKENQTIRSDFEDVYYNGINLRIGWQTHGGKDFYNRLYNYPVYGLGVYASTFHSTEIGKPIALYGFVAVPMFPARFRRWDLNYRISLGVASNFRPFDAEENPLNIMLGSRQNVFADIGAQVNYRLNNRWQAGAGIAFHHFSNGAIRLPNMGINLLPLTLSLTYRNSDRVQFTPVTIPPAERDGRMHIHYAAGIKQMSRDINDRYFKSTLGVYWSLPAGHKWRLGVGGDLFYANSGARKEFAGERAGKLSAVLSGGPALYVDHILTRRLYLNGNAGWYLNRNEFNGEVRPVFLRIGIRYKVLRNLYTGVSIKAHNAKADYIEWTTGYTFSLKNARTFQ